MTLELWNFLEGSGKMCRWIDEEEGSSRGRSEGSKGMFQEAVSRELASVKAESTCMR